MEAEQVVQKILSDAKAEAEDIRKQADDKEAAEQAKIDDQLAEYEKQTDSITQKAADAKKLHLLAAARMDMAKQFLAEKRKILDEVFAQVREKLLSLPDDQYRRLITNLMLKAVETGDEEVIIDENEKRIDRNLIDHVNQRLNPNQKPNLRLSEEKQNLGGGFILKRDKIKNNVSFGVLLAQARRDLEIELAKELFS